MTVATPAHRPATGYIVPMVTFLVLTGLEAWVPPASYPWYYAAKIAIVAACLLSFRAPLADLTPTPRLLPAAILTGLVVFVLWVGIEKAVPYPHVGSRAGFNPFDGIDGAAGQYAFIAVRLFGLAVVVPVMEELFWRSFLLRYLTRDDFTSVPVAGFSWTAFAIVAVLFASAHPEWLPAILTAAIYGLFVRRTSSIYGAAVAHATTNAALGAYVLLFQDWVFW